jgi:hypothetical protein
MVVECRNQECTDGVQLIQLSKKLLRVTKKYTDSKIYILCFHITFVLTLFAPVFSNIQGTYRNECRASHKMAVKADRYK